MKSLQKINKLSCEQIYNVWSTEPELIKVLDFRSDLEFKRAHIPGALHCDLRNYEAALAGLGEKLAVLIVHEQDELFLQTKLKDFDNFVFLHQCSRWKDLKFPVAGDEATKIEVSLNRIFPKFRGAPMNQDTMVYQLFESTTSTYTYIIADLKSKEAAIIDPVLETVDRDLKVIEEVGLKLRYVLDTHVHADHITGAHEIRKRLGAKTGVSAEANVSGADLPLEDGQELSLGSKTIRVIATPGHTDTCLTFYFEGMIFTGDALLIRTCGRTDFQQGSPEKLFHSVREKLFKLDDETVIYPGHDYRGYTQSTIGQEKKFNARLKESYSLEDFKKIMAELKLAHPKKIHEAVPANLAGGIPQDNRALHPQVVDGVPEVNVEDLHANMDKVLQKKVLMIDVRRPEEFNNELGHIKGSRLVTLGPDLTEFLQKGDRNQEIVFICRSGARSGNATIESAKLGYKFTMNMVGGMIRWNESHFSVERNEV